MRVVGLIVEYNPFHNGHAYHFQQAKSITGADYVIAIMSGNFLQRGIPALMDQWSRAEIALLNGVDLVIQLPIYFSTASAEFFATASVELLNQLGVVDSICFGSESGDIKVLEQIASILVDEPDEYQVYLKDYLSQGNSFPLARSKALLDYIQSTTPMMPYEVLCSTIESPNNILGIEYIKALIRTKSSIQAYTLQRQVADYHDLSLDQKIASASAIRQHLESNQELKSLAWNVPIKTYEKMECLYQKSFPIFLDDFTPLLYHRLLNTTPDKLLEIVDVSEGLEDRILNCSQNLLPISKLIESIKSKRFTYTRIQRALLHILLDIRKTDFEMFKSLHYNQYIKILGFKQESQPLLKSIKTHSQLPIISNVNKAFNQLTTPAIKMLNKDIYGTNLYNLMVYEKFGTQIPNDLTHKFITL
jgi:predicted nucleotidyltransferase